jgi:methyl-accepting chemotaxis protein
VNWTVSRRISAGFGIGAALVLIMALVGIWALRETTSAYTEAVDAERDVLLRAIEARGGVRNANIAYLRLLLAGEPAYEGEMTSAMETARTAMDQLRLDSRVQDRAPWSDALRLLGDWEAAVNQAVTLAGAGALDEALLVRRERIQPIREQLETRIAAGIEDAIEHTDVAVAAARATATNSERGILIGLILAGLVFGITALLLNRAIAAPLQDTSNVLATTAAEILATTTQQASGATESLAAVTQTAATVDEVVQTAEQSAERARTVASSAARAAEIGLQGRQAVDTTVAEMADVRERMDGIGESIRALSEQAQAIGEIMSTVTDLAEQTNLLALNAAIEAARAGEQGRGFAVVAGEIKNLAEQSKDGTARVRQILEQVQRAMTAAVAATEQGNRKVGDVVNQVAEAGDTIRQLADAVATAAQAAAQISASAGQQSTGMAQIRQAIGNIQQSSQQNLAATRQAESAAQELNRLGTRLLDLVGTGAQPVRNR